MVNPKKLKDKEVRIFKNLPICSFKFLKMRVMSEGILFLHSGRFYSILSSTSGVFFLISGIFQVNVAQIKSGKIFFLKTTNINILAQICVLESGCELELEKNMFEQT